MDEFKGYDVLTKNEENEEVEYIIEGRIPLVKWELKKNDSKWTIKNSLTNKHYYLKVDEVHPEKNIHDFLHSIEAYNDRMTPKTQNSIVDYNSLTKDIFLTGKATLWIKADKERIIQSTYTYLPNFGQVQMQDYEHNTSYAINEDTVSGDMSSIGGSLKQPTAKNYEDNDEYISIDQLKKKKKRKLIINLEEE